MRAIVPVLLALAFVGGILLFPRALEPGRSERDALSLDLLQPGSGRLASEDWYLGSRAVDVSRDAAGARVVTRSGTRYVLLSRSLAVLPESCYALSFSGRTRTGSWAIRVTDEKLRTTLRELAVPRRPNPTRVSGAFNTEDRRRISVVVGARSPSSAVLDDVRLDRIPDDACARPTASP